MASFTGYFDESGTHGAPFIAVAGLIASDDHWKHFAREWRTALGSKGLNSFKMQWFEKRKGPFRDWSEKDRRDFLNLLLGVVIRRVNYAVLCGLSMRDYDELITGEIKQAAGSAYCFAANGCVHLAAEWAREHSYEPLVHVFDRGHKNSQDFLTAFTIDQAADKIKEFYHCRSVSLGDEIDFAPLQAADLIAYETWKHVENEYSEKPRPRRYPFERLMGIPHRTRMFDRPGFQAIRDRWLRFGTFMPQP